MVSLQKLKDSHKELSMVKGQVASLQVSLHSAQGAITKLKGELSTSNFKLEEAKRKFKEVEHKASRLQ